MARLARGETINPAKTQVLHCIQRCVRRAFLCGKDTTTGQCFDHRRGWIRDRLKFLASVFGIDCLTYAVLSNHAHIVLRSRPDVVVSWSDREVAQRWLRLYPKRRDEHGDPEEPSEPELNTIVNNPDRLAELRLRLSDISWWMRCLAEYIARRSNAEDDCSGRFWEGRYRGENLLDEAALLACAMYVDLNPVRAAMAETPETSEFTGAKDRLDDRAARFVARSDQPRLPDDVPDGAAVDVTVDRSEHGWQRTGARPKSGWLSPIGIDEQKDELGPDPDTTGRRASHKGFLSISLTDYIKLLDWTGRAIRTDRRGAIPAHLAPILTRIGVNSEHWYNVVTRFGTLFKQAAGSTENLAAEARRRGVRWLQGPGARLLSTASG